MKAFLHKAAAFVRKDFQIESSYKFHFLSRALDSVVLLIFFYFLNRLVASSNSPQLERYGGNYLSFVVIGLAFARYFQLTLTMFSDSIRQAQVTGCLEAMLSTATDCGSIVLMSSLYGLMSGAVQLMIILGLGAFLLGVDLSHMNILATLLVFLLSILSFVAFGVLSASAILYLKRGDPLTWILGGMGTMVGGAYFPISVLPVWLQKVAMLIPITYSLDALRLTLLKGYSVAMVSNSLINLGLMVLVLLPGSLLLFAYTVRRGRKEGTLMQY